LCKVEKLSIVLASAMSTGSSCAWYHISVSRPDFQGCVVLRSHELCLHHLRGNPGCPSLILRVFLKHQLVTTDTLVPRL